MWFIVPWSVESLVILSIAVWCLPCWLGFDGKCSLSIRERHQLGTLICTKEQQLSKVSNRSISQVYSYWELNWDLCRQYTYLPLKYDHPFFFLFERSCQDLVCPWKGLLKNKMMRKIKSQGLPPFLLGVQKRRTNWSWQNVVAQFFFLHTLI